MTVAPSDASPSEIASPMPLPPPTTTAVCFERFICPAEYETADRMKAHVFHAWPSGLKLGMKESRMRAATHCHEIQTK